MTRLLITYPMCAKLIREIIIIAAEVLLEQLWKRACSIKLSKEEILQIKVFISTKNFYGTAP